MLLPPTLPNERRSYLQPFVSFYAHFIYNGNNCGIWKGGHHAKQIEMYRLDYRIDFTCADGD
ncbi:hypothetical protein JCM16418A_33280 [Paenibacillus pini]